LCFTGIQAFGQDSSSTLKHCGRIASFSIRRVPDVIILLASRSTLFGHLTTRRQVGWTGETRPGLPAWASPTVVSSDARAALMALGLKADAPDRGIRVLRPHALSVW
jgi:hypothetical protein